MSLLLVLLSSALHSSSVPLGNAQRATPYSLLPTELPASNWVFSQRRRKRRTQLSKQPPLQIVEGQEEALPTRGQLFCKMYLKSAFFGAIPVTASFGAGLGYNSYSDSQRARGPFNFQYLAEGAAISTLFVASNIFFANPTFMVRSALNEARNNGYDTTNHGTSHVLSGLINGGLAAGAVYSILSLAENELVAIVIGVLYALISPALTTAIVNHYSVVKRRTIGSFEEQSFETAPTGIYGGKLSLRF